MYCESNCVNWVDFTIGNCCFGISFGFLETACGRCSHIICKAKIFLLKICFLKFAIFVILVSINFARVDFLNINLLFFFLFSRKGLFIFLKCDVHGGDFSRPRFVNLFLILSKTFVVYVCMYICVYICIYTSCMYPLKTGKMSVYFPVKADNSLYHIIAFHHIERGLKSIETAIESIEVVPHTKYSHCEM